MTDHDHDKQLCNGQRANQPEGTLCTRPAGWGTDHPGIGRCKRHGGSTRSHRAAANMEIARRAVERFGLVDHVEEVDPRDVLAEELWRSLVTVRGLDFVVSELGLDVHGPTYHASGFATGEAKPHVLWVMWQEQRAHLKAVAAEAARAGVEARRMQLAEDMAEQVATLLKAIFGDPALGMDEEQRQVAMTVSARHLRLVSAGA